MPNLRKLKIEVGDLVKVYQVPSYWNSSTSSKNPFDIEYPALIEIVAITDRSYGNCPAVGGKWLKEDTIHGFSGRTFLDETNFQYISKNEGKYLHKKFIKQLYNKKS